MHSGLLNEAWEEWQKLGEIALSDRRRVAFLLNNLAAVSDKSGQWEKAGDYYDRALAMFRDGDQGRAATLANKGELYASLGDFKKARNFYEEALSILPAEKFDSEIKASILLNFGQLFFLERDLPNAVKSFEQARAAKPSQRKLADVLTNLGVAFASQGKLHEAMEAYQQALAIQLEQHDKRGQALSLQKRGETHHALKPQPQAVEDLKNALALWESVKDVRGAASTLDALARIEREHGNFIEALKYNNQSIDIVESQRTTLSSHRLKTMYFATQESYYELNIDLNMQLKKATGEDRYLVQAFETNEKARARVLLDALQERVVGRETNQTSDPKLSHLIDQRHRLLSQLTAKGHARTRLLNTTPNPTQLAAFDKEVDTISERIDSLDAQIRSQSPRFDALTRPQPSNLKESQKELDNDTSIVEYALSEKRSYAWVVTADSIKGVELPSKKEIEDAADRLTEILKAGGNLPEPRTQKELRHAKYVEASTSLSRKILQPISHLLTKKRLVIVADGVLQTVSFTALPSPTVGETSVASAHGTQVPQPTRRLLIHDHEIVSLPSASVLAVQRRLIKNRKPAPHALAIFADPVFEPNDERVSRAKKKNAGGGPVAVAPQPSRVEPWKEGMRDLGIDKILTLPFSGREANDISKLVPEGEAFVATGFAANRATAMSPKLAKYRIVHFATHGFLNLEHPDLSGIVFSLLDEKGNPQEGFLYLHDIYNLNLPAELVVLSACQTGVGKQVKGEGLIALTRGFMYAGASRLVASLWKVDDAATAELMARFYKEMFTNGKRPAEALRDAQLDLSKLRRYSAPYFWAGFVLQGEWR